MTNMTMVCYAGEHKTLKEYCNRKGIKINDFLHCAVDFFLRGSDTEQNKVIADYFEECNAAQALHA